MATLATGSQQQSQLILRLPEQLAEKTHRILKEQRQRQQHQSHSKHRSRKAQMDSEEKQICQSFDIRPQDSNNPSNEFVVTFESKEYPALLMNLPTPVETHKTFDNKIFLKSGDIGQILQVFETAEERSRAKRSIRKTYYGDYYSSGLSPPTQDIVQRRFELTHRHDPSHFLPYRIRHVVEEIQRFGNTIQAANNAAASVTAAAATSSRGNGRGARSSNSNSSAAVDAPEVDEQGRIVLSETVTEEVVDFEDWMLDREASEAASATVAAATSSSSSSSSWRRLVGVSIVIEEQDWLGDDGARLLGLQQQQYANSSNSNSSNSSRSKTRNALLLLQHPELLLTEELREEIEIDEREEQRLKENKQKKQLTAQAKVIETIDNGIGDDKGSRSKTGGSSSSSSVISNTVDTATTTMEIEEAAQLVPSASEESAVAAKESAEGVAAMTIATEQSSLKPNEKASAVTATEESAAVEEEDADANLIADDFEEEDDTEAVEAAATAADAVNNSGDESNDDDNEEEEDVDAWMNTV